MIKNRNYSLSFAAAAAGILLTMAANAAEVDAVLDWSRRVQLSTTVTGVVADIRVNTGDRVKQGDLLLALDDRIMKANVDKTSAEVDRSTRLHKEAERELDRQQELFDRTVLSEHELELARIGLDDAKARLKAAEAAKVKAQVDFEHAHVRAPFDAIVLARHAELGQTIISTDQPAPLVELGEAGKMIASMTVSLGTANKLKVGQSVPVVIGGKKYTGKIQAVGFEPVPGKKKRYPVAVEVPIDGRLLRAGQGARVVLP
jgi:multidrug efflux system membrane fusion protein